MQIVVNINIEEPVFLPFSYYPKLSASIYSKMKETDESFAEQLHDGEMHRSRIKLFSFSPLHSKYLEIHKGGKDTTGGITFTGPSSFKISSPWPELLNKVGEGLYSKRELRIGSQLFKVNTIKLVQPPEFKTTMQWQPTQVGSIVTSWSPKERQEKLYAFPDHPADGQACETLLRTNIVHKWCRLCEIRPDIAQQWSGEKEKGNLRELYSPDDISITFLPFNERQPYKTKLHYIKEFPVKSWRTKIRMAAPVALQKVVFSSGIGEMNSMGFGLVEGK